MAFKEGLRDSSGDEVPEAITPEILIHGHSLTSLNIIPDLQNTSNEEGNWIPGKDHVEVVRGSFSKLKKIRAKLIENYNCQFLGNLMHQATNEKERYKAVTHKKLEVGDIVLLKEPYMKPFNFPMAIVKDLQINDLGEVTGAVVRKGSSRELLKRHVTSLIPILRSSNSSIQADDSEEKETNSANADNSKKREKRKAAIVSESKTKRMLKDL